jgi:hypothetical protein
MSHGASYREINPRLLERSVTGGDTETKSLLFRKKGRNAMNLGGRRAPDCWEMPVVKGFLSGQAINS